MKTLWLALLISFLFHCVVLGILAVLPLWTGPYLIWLVGVLAIVLFALRRLQHHKEQNKINARWDTGVWDE